MISDVVCVLAPVLESFMGEILMFVVLEALFNESVRLVPGYKKAIEEHMHIMAACEPPDVHHTLQSIKIWTAIFI